MAAYDVLAWSVCLKKFNGWSKFKKISSIFTKKNKMRSTNFNKNSIQLCTDFYIHRVVYKILSLNTCAYIQESVCL